MTTDPTRPPDRDDRLNDVIAACLEDAECGRLDRAEVLARHPEFAAELADFFTGRDLLDRMAAPLRAGSADGPPSDRPGESDGDPGRAADRSPDGAPGPEACLLGDYLLLREVGRGGMGVVYEAEQISLRRRVALKILPFAAALDARQLQRFRNEAQAAAQLHHGNIVPVFAVGSERGVHYYAMQFIDGRTLADVIRELRRADGSDRADSRSRPSSAGPAAPAPPPGTGSAAADTRPLAALSTEPAAKGGAYFRAVARLGVQAAQALEHAHGCGVVHRDVKPANLLVDARGHLWVTDFGLARLQGEAGLTRSGDLLGTVRYMSPEQALGRPALVDPRSDIYSLGATLYELLTLEPAVAGGDRQELLRRIAADDPRPLRRLNPAVPADLETVVLKALAKDPAERYGSARELADDLERYLRDQPVRAKRPTLRGVAAKWLRRHKAVVRGAVAALAAAVVILGLSSWALWRQAGQTRLEKERAEENLRLALDSLDRLYLRAAEERSPRDPEWERQNRELLQSALAFYEALARQNRDGAAVRRLAARAYARAGDIRRKLDQPGPAEEAYRQAIALTESVAAEFPGDPLDRERLAGALMNLGIVLEAARRLDEAERALGRAQGLYRELAAERPDQPLHRRHLGHCAKNLGDTWETAGRPHQAEAAYRRALALREDLLAEYPAEADYQEDLALTLQGLGRLLGTLNRTEEAEAAFRRALPLLQKLAADYPDRPYYRLVLASGRTNFAVLLRAAGRPPQAEEEVRRAQDETRRLAADFPGVPEYRRRQAGDHNFLSILLTEAGRHAEAEAQFRQAVDLLEPLVAGPHVAKSRADLADCHHNWGVLLRGMKCPDEADRHLRLAQGIRQKLVDEVPDVPAHWKHLAGSYQEIGELLFDQRRPREAEQAWADGVAVLGRLARDWPAVPAHRHELANGHYNLARAAWRTGRYGEAESACRRATDLHARLAGEFPLVPAHRRHLADDQDLLGMVLDAAGQPGPAEQAFRQAAAAKRRLADELPRVPDHRHSLALTQLHLGDLLLLKGRRLPEAEAAYREALAVLEKLVDECPAVAKYRHELANTFTRVANLLAKTDRAPEAEAAYRQVLAHYERLVAEFAAVADYREKAGRAHVRLAILLAGAGRPDEAEESYRRALKLHPADARANNNLAWLLATAADPGRLKPAEAVALAKRAVELAPKDRDYWGTLGTAHYRAGDWPGAKAALEQALRLDGEGTSFEWFVLALAHARLGDAGPARECYDRAVQWMEKHKPQDAELRRFRAEAEAVLGVAPPRPADKSAPP